MLYFSKLRRASTARPCLTGVELISTWADGTCTVSQTQQATVTMEYSLQELSCIWKE